MTGDKETNLVAIKKEPIFDQSDMDTVTNNVQGPLNIKQEIIDDNCCDVNNDTETKSTNEYRGDVDEFVSKSHKQLMAAVNEGETFENDTDNCKVNDDSSSDVSKLEAISHVVQKESAIWGSSKPKKGMRKKDLSDEIKQLTQDNSKRVITRRRPKKFLEPSKCEVCGKEFSLPCHLKRHMISHNEEKSFVCYICNKTFRREDNLKAHLMGHAGDKPYACHLCDKAFTHLSTLKTHVDTHDLEKCHKCVVCNKIFKYKSNLKTHMKSHTGEKPYACEYCEKCFSTSTNLKHHTLIHTGERPRECHICHKSYTHLSTLKKHLMTHSGEKPHSCKVCGKKFKQGAHLKSHMATHTGDKAFVCHFCPKKFTQSCNLKRHLQTHEKNAAFLAAFEAGNIGEFDSLDYSMDESTVASDSQDHSVCESTVEGDESNSGVGPILEKNRPPAFPSLEMFDSGENLPQDLRVKQQDFVKNDFGESRLEMQSISSTFDSDEPQDLSIRQKDSTEQKDTELDESGSENNRKDNSVEYSISGAGKDLVCEHVLARRAS